MPKLYTNPHPHSHNLSSLRINAQPWQTNLQFMHNIVILSFVSFDLPSYIGCGTQCASVDAIAVKDSIAKQAENQNCLALTV